MPAAAVIPAPAAYIYIAAFKKLVVDTSDAGGRTAAPVASRPTEPGAEGVRRLRLIAWSRRRCTFTLRKLNRSEEASSLNSSAWYDGTWARTHFVGSGVCEPMINRDCRGHSYSGARGEIQGPPEDVPLRKHLPRMFSLIKNESQRCEGDQIPP